MQEAQQKLSKVKSPKKQKLPAKKGARDSPDSSATEEAEEVAEASDSPVRKKRKGDEQENGAREESVDEEKERIEAQVKEDKRLLKKWEKEVNWDHLVEEVSTMERSDDETLRAKLVL